MGVTGRRRHLAGLRVNVRQRHQEDAAAGDGAALLELGGDGDLAHRDRTVRRAADMDTALAVGLEVAGVNLELLGRRLHHDAPRLLGGGDHGVADAMGAAGRKRAHAVRTGVGVSAIHVNVLDRHAEGLRTDLPHDRLQALAEIDRRECDGELAGRVRVHQRLARVAAEIHPDRVVNRGHAPSAMPGHGQRLLVPKTEENRVTPCRVWAGLGDGGGARAGAGAVGGTIGAGARAGRS